MSTNITRTVLKYGAIMALASVPLKRILSDEQQDATDLLLRVGFIVSIASVPVGLWALSRWPENPMIPSAILTALAFVIKDHMLTASKGEVEADFDARSPQAISAS